MHFFGGGGEQSTDLVIATCVSSLLQESFIGNRKKCQIVYTITHVTLKSLF